MVTFLSGGTGTPKLLSGIIGNEDVVVVGNTGDDIEIGNMIVCPDLDTVMSLFSGLLDRKKWWGVENDTFQTHKLLVEFAEKSGWNGEAHITASASRIITVITCHCNHSSQLKHSLLSRS